MKIKAGIIGGAGYTGGELIRLLLKHPHTELQFVQSSSHTGKPIYDAHHDLLGETELCFTAKPDLSVAVIFLCSGHGAAKQFMTENKVPDETVVIDLSQDFRHKGTNTSGNREFVYGLPELNREKLRLATSVANPGCFATAIELTLLPLAALGQLTGDVHINAVTGSTGAGQALSDTTHFSWRSNNASVYKPFVHQHLQEIKESVQRLQPVFKSDLLFIPQRGAFTRGILASVYFETDFTADELNAIYNDFYDHHPFVWIAPFAVDIKQVLGTNKCFIQIEKHGNKTFVTSVIDNLLKGASGQAVQNMNLIFRFDESAGLQLKPSAF